MERIIKTLFWLAVLVAAGIYVSGALAFRAANINAFLDGWDDATRRGDASAICDTTAPDLTYSEHDHFGAREENREGDREQFCAYLQKAVPLLAQHVKSTDVTREGLTVTRPGLHWWTAEVSYRERREVTLDTGVVLKQDSEDHLTLQKTLQGLRVQRLETDSRLVQ